MDDYEVYEYEEDWDNEDESVIGIMLGWASIFGGGWLMAVLLNCFM